LAKGGHLSKRHFATEPSHGDRRCARKANSIVEGTDKRSWYAWWAAWMGWTLDAFDFTVFLLIMVPIAEELHVPLPAVALLTIKLWMRLVGAVAAGWLADRVGRKNGRLAYRVLSGLAST
jgi:MFS family permease